MLYKGSTITERPYLPSMRPDPSRTDSSLGLLAARYLQGQIQKLLENLEIARLAGDVEGIHRSRVASRRPENTKVLVERTGEGQLAVFIPPKGFRGALKGMLVFSIIWTTFTLIISGGMISSGDIFEGLFGALFVLGILGIFLTVGIGMLGYTIYSAFVKTFILVERGRVVLRTVFRTRERMKEFPMSPADTRAKLEESYRENDRPVYRIAIKGGGANARFGTALDNAEKRWLVATINEFISDLDG